MYLFKSTLALIMPVVRPKIGIEINGTVVRRMEECHFTTLGLIAMGDQLALKEFCATNEENWDEEVERPRGFLNHHRKRSGNADYGGSIVAQKRAKKSTLKVEFGWKHWIGNRCVQVKKDKGVRERTLDMKRSANYQECLLKAQNIFYPNGTSQHGMLVDMEKPYLANYDGFKINEEGFTVEGCRGTKSTLRLYLVTKAKTQADSRPQGNSLSSYPTEEISHPQNSYSHVQGMPVTPATTAGTTQACFLPVEMFPSPGGENSIFPNWIHDTKDMMSSLLQNDSSPVVTVGPQGNSLSSYPTEWQYSVQQVPQELPVNFNMMPISESEDSGYQADGNGLPSDRELIGSHLDRVLFGDQNLTSNLTNYGESSESPSAHGSDPTSVHQDGDHYSGVSRSVQGISPQEGSTKGGYPFSIFLSEPLPEDITSGKAEFCHVATANLTKLKPHVFQGTVPGSPHLGDVPVTVMTQTGQHLGITHFKYIDGDYQMAMELLSGRANISNVFSIITKKFETSLHVDCSNQTKQQHSLQFLQLLVYTAALTGEKHLIEIIFSTSAGQIVFDSYKGRAQLPEDVARANGHDDLANYLQDLTTRFSKEPEFTQKEAHVIDWPELEAAATAARTRGCHTEEKSSDDRSENNSDTCYFADVETSSIDSPELSRSTSEDDTLEPYSREKTQASAHQSISSIVKGAFAENGTMQRIRQNIEGVKQKSTVLILEDSHFDSSLPEVVKGLNYALAFQLATGSENIPRHLHTANERFLASRESIICQPTISFCSYPVGLIESSLVKNNNDHTLRIVASKPSNQLNEDIFAGVCTQMPIEKAIQVKWKSSDMSVKQLRSHTHCDLWVFTSAFRPTRKTLFVYFADRRDALPHNYFFEDEDTESQIRCWKWNRSENNSLKFTERLEADKLPPGMTHL
ncbi:uncharacterized protein [Montipora foliosa]|uniref:uncharacterized protein isoform X2 n=1 Tax=Montipora foliosa TaxID=591990 RepID=UPI0035F1D7CE